MSVLLLWFPVGICITVRDIPVLCFGPCAVAVSPHVGDELGARPYVCVPEAVDGILANVPMYGYAVLVKVHPLVWDFAFSSRSSTTLPWSSSLSTCKWTTHPASGQSPSSAHLRAFSHASWRLVASMSVPPTSPSSTRVMLYVCVIVPPQTTPVVWLLPRGLCKPPVSSVPWSRDQRFALLSAQATRRTT